MRIIALLTCFIFIGCVTRQDSSQNANLSSEFAQYQNKYGNDKSNGVERFPHAIASKIKVYELDCSGECEFAVFKNRVSSGKEITQNDFDTLISILENPNSYGNGTVSCFSPKIGLVLYDDEDVPMELLSICLNCNNYRTKPGNIEVELTEDQLNGFNLKTRNKLRNLFSGWGIDYYGFSMLWDDTTAYKKYLGIDDKLGQRANDTSFIHQEHFDDDYHAIYIDTDKESEHRKRLLDFQFGAQDSLNYFQWFNYFEDNGVGEFDNHDLMDIDQEWIPVYRYEDGFYLYTPNDWGNTGRILISDSTFTSWNMEGPHPNLLQSIKKMGNDYRIVYANSMRFPEIDSLDLITLDNKTKLSAIVDPSKSDTFVHCLYIPKNKNANFDLIVNYSKIDPIEEMDFEKIDWSQYKRRN